MSSLRGHDQLYALVEDTKERVKLALDAHERQGRRIHLVRVEEARFEALKATYKPLHYSGFTYNHEEGMWELWGVWCQKAPPKTGISYWRQCC